MLGHFTVAGTDFDPTVLIPMNRGSQTMLVVSEGDHGVRRDADGACDLFAPVEVFQKMLAEALACHGWNSVAGRGVHEGFVNRCTNRVSVALEDSVCYGSFG